MDLDRKIININGTSQFIFVNLKIPFLILGNPNWNPDKMSKTQPSFIISCVYKSKLGGKLGA